MALVFLFALASVGLMIVGASHGAMTFGVVLAMSCFVLLASGVFVALLRMAKHWEDSDERS